MNNSAANPLDLPDDSPVAPSAPASPAVRGVETPATPPAEAVEDPILDSAAERPVRSPVVSSLRTNVQALANRVSSPIALSSGKVTQEQLKSLQEKLTVGIEELAHTEDYKLLEQVCTFLQSRNCLEDILNLVTEPFDSIAELNLALLTKFYARSNISMPEAQTEAYLQLTILKRKLSLKVLDLSSYIGKNKKTHYSATELLQLIARNRFDQYTQSPNSTEGSRKTYSSKSQAFDKINFEMNPEQLQNYFIKNEISRDDVEHLAVNLYSFLNYRNKASGEQIRYKDANEEAKVRAFLEKLFKILAVADLKTLEEAHKDKPLTAEEMASSVSNPNESLIADASRSTTIPNKKTFEIRRKEIMKKAKKEHWSAEQLDSALSQAGLLPKQINSAQRSLAVSKVLRAPVRGLKAVGRGFKAFGEGAAASWRYITAPRWFNWPMRYSKKAIMNAPKNLLALGGFLAQTTQSTITNVVTAGTIVALAPLKVIKSVVDGVKKGFSWLKK